jgi:hypothetical protein
MRRAVASLRSECDFGDLQSSNIAENDTRFMPCGGFSPGAATRGRDFVGCAVANRSQSYSYTYAR